MFDRIVVAVDGSACGERAVEAAGDLAALSGGEVVVAHLAETIAMWGAVVDNETPEEAIDLADDAVRKLKDRGVSARSEVRTCFRGGVSRAIVTIGRDEDADIIVMGSRGHGEVIELLLGSVAHRVVHLANVPVLIVR